MYLKRMDLLGFKSFTNKTKIELEQGISCIVGPNGSGKSNICDALRWVLGEQSSRSMRGGKMEDVIFAGSQKRKPLGMAEVSITLDNVDGYLALPFEEITVTRRTFRSGQSEYLLNKQSCRLKDIQNIFLDSGIGLEGISIIGQGQINELISARPEERRSVVEEAAGIIKYRNRKKQAVVKINETRQNLQRLDDILGELSARIEPLAEQAAKAEEYLALKEQKDHLEIGISFLSLQDIGGKLAEIRRILDAEQDAFFAEEALRAGLATQIEELSQMLAVFEEEIASLQKSFFVLQGEKEQSRTDIIVLQE
ncbi:MAG: AAA family ATPase, partial [Clostridiales bacterium]